MPDRTDEEAPEEGGIEQKGHEDGEDEDDASREENRHSTMF